MEINETTAYRGHIITLRFDRAESLCYCEIDNADSQEFPYAHTGSRAVETARSIIDGMESHEGGATAPSFTPE